MKNKSCVIYHMVPFSIKDLERAQCSLRAKEWLCWQDRGGWSRSASSSLNSPFRCFLGLEEIKDGLIKSGYYYSIDRSELGPRFTFESVLLTDPVSQVYLENDFHILIDSAGRQGLFVYGMSIERCPWEHLLLISTYLCKYLYSGFGFELQFANDVSEKITIIELLQSSTGEDICFFEDSAPDQGYSRRTHVAAMCRFDDESDLKKEIENWGEKYYSMTGENYVNNILSGVYLCTSGNESFFALPPTGFANALFNQFSSIYLPVIAAAVLMKNVVKEYVAGIGQNEDMFDKSQQMKLLLALSASRYTVINTIFEQCKKSQNMSEEIEAINGYLSYKIEKENRDRHLREAKSDHRRDVGITILTVSQVLFALIAYLGIKDILGDPAGQPWKTISAILLTIMLISFVLLILRKPKN